MNIMIDHTFMQPIYEQITEQIKYQILHDTLQGGEALPVGAYTGKRIKDQCTYEWFERVTQIGMAPFIITGILFTIMVFLHKYPYFG